jgi:hypothetical protein
MQDQQESKPPVKFSTHVAAAAMFSAPIRGLLCKRDTMGKRILRHPLALIGIAAPLLWAAATESPWMWGLTGLGVIGIATQVRSKGHTMSIGESRWGDKVDTAILTLAGIGLCFVDRNAGAYLIAMACADAVTRWWVNRKQEMQDDDVTDGMIEAKARGFRVRNRGV